jgi:hypothetical protein
MGEGGGGGLVGYECLVDAGNRHQPKIRRATCRYEARRNGKDKRQGAGASKAWRKAPCTLFKEAE